ncbi:MAG: hypothetical protein JNN22_00840 [Rhodospirillales bacterium]|nr:hypothetical protein [Rhodospirillales bacterium]
MAVVRIFPTPRPAAHAGEPRLADLIDDPVAQVMMRRDGVTRDGLLALMGGLRPCISNPACGSA